MSVKKTRLPIAFDFNARTELVDATTGYEPFLAKDEKVLNGVFSKRGEDIYVSSRPGHKYIQPKPGATSLKGLYYLGIDQPGTGFFSDTLYTVDETTLYSRTANTNVSPTSPWSSAGALPVAPSSAPYAASGLTDFVATSGNPYVFFHNNSLAWVHNPVLNTNTLVGAAITATGAFGAGVTLARGSVYMNDTVFVMTAGTARIYNSAVENPLSWGALDYISMTTIHGNGLALSKSHNYLVALGDNGVEFFYYAGNPTGSPLAANLSAASTVGCVSGNSVITIGDTIFFVGRDSSGRIGVYQIEGTQVTKISSESVDKVLRRWANSSGYTLSDYLVCNGMTPPSGNTIYRINLLAINSGVPPISLVYDKTNNIWSVWTNVKDPTYPLLYNFYVSDNNSNIYCIDSLTGETCIVTSQATQAYDSSSTTNYPVDFKIRTPNLDFDTMNRKICYSLEAIVNYTKNNSFTLSIRHSDDDYSTWSTARTLTYDSTVSRPVIYLLGSFRRRAFEISVNNSLIGISIKALEMNIQEGTN